MVLKQILDYTMMLGERGEHSRSLTYLSKQLNSVLSEDIRAIDAELINLPVHLYSTRSLVHALAVTYYYKEGLSNRPLFFDKVYNELVFVRGLFSEEEALLILQ